MRKFLMVLIISFCLLGTLGFANASTFDEVMLSGGNRLVDLQQNDGGWDWPLDDGNPADASPINTVGPIAMGLAQAYSQTGSASQLTALQNAGSLLLNKTNNFSPSDGYLAVALDSVFGGSAYSTHVLDNFYTPLADGTYDRNGAGVQYTTASYVSLIDTARANQGIANLAAWDIGMGLFSAAAIGADTSFWIAGTNAELSTLVYGSNYDVIGLSGAILGLATAGAPFDPALADTLAGYQIENGGWAWRSDYVIPNDNNESVQETAYAILALLAVDPILYSNQIKSGANWLMDVQLATGGWESYSGAGENNEITGEALWATNAAVPEPTTIVLFGLGLLGVAGVSRKKTA